MEKGKVKTTSEDGRTDDKDYEVSEVAAREEEMLAFWAEHDIFNKSVETPAGQEPAGDFVFYDGPPFATGLPHYGHILASTIKDAIPRFWTMNGYRVRRKWGWDCHGLPLENLIEKKLGLATKRDIEEYGVKNFNEAARGAVMEYASDWKEIIPRMGRWADMDDDYKTMDSTYTESVWWVFKTLNEKGLVYEGFKSMHLCPRCGTTLSNFEVNQGYQDIKDIAVTVKLPLVDEPSTSLLVWTTTPWTLPGNMAAAVHKDGDYVKVKAKTDNGEETVILGKTRLEQLGTEDYEVVEELKGKELVGKTYEPPFPFFQNQEFPGKENAWKIYHADYVEMEGEGTGAVHLAPAYGEEDMELAKAEGIPIIHHVDESGHFMPFVEGFNCELVKPKDDEESGVMHIDSDIEVVKKLKETDKLFRKENITHSYPHCWRCDTPLLNYATNSWFVKVTDIKDKLVKENSQVHWVPEHVGKNRFGKWLEGARDWAVSRQRYWGAPLPVWKNPETGDYKIIGSLKELQEYVPKSGNQYFLMRHGESESNATGHSSTKLNAKNPLTEAGIKQVEEAVVDLKNKNIDLIIASPYERTKQTAEMIKAALSLSDEQLVFEDRLGEIKLGDMDGADLATYHAFLSEGEIWSEQTPENGESWNDVKRRVGEWLYEIDKQYKDKNILVVGHNSPLRMLGTVATGMSLKDSQFDHDEDTKRFNNAEVRDMTFVALPHNDNYELDYHRPYIDEVELYEGETKLERIKDVFDCWFESGAMPYGQLHYPFENKDAFEKKFYPANFIAEGLDQTRGWFYSLIVLGTALFKKSPYQNVIVNGLVLAEDGKKMSKKLQNYPDPMAVADRVGVDAMRFYLLSSQVVRGEDLNFSEKEVLELQRKNIGRLHNVLQMYQQYSEGETAKADSTNVLDRWVVARLNELIKESTIGYQNYELDKATRPVTDFIDDLSVWYLRRSRDRLKGDDTEDKQAALATLRYVMQNLAKVMAPVMPFYAEYLWQQVKEANEAESVHLTAWPQTIEADPVVLGEMSIVRELVSLALEVRAKANIKVRQPLKTLSINIEMEPEYAQVIADEINVKEVKYDPELSERAKLDTEITPELKAEGEVRELMRAVQAMRKEANLEASDQIALLVSTGEAGQRLVEEYQEQITKTVGASSIDFGNTEGTEVSTGEHKFTLGIKKL